MGVELLVNFDNPAGIFRPGEVITGNVTVYTSSQITATGLTLSFHGEGFVEWTERETVRDDRIAFAGIDPLASNHHHGHDHANIQHNHHNHQQTMPGYTSREKQYRNQESYINSLMALPLGTNGNLSYSLGHSIELRAGYFQQIPFTFQLPLSIPSSCKLAHGLIKYFAETSLKIKQSLLVFSMETSKTTKKEFTVAGTLDLSHVNDALSPVYAQQTEQFNKGFFCCCCISGAQGNFMMELRLARTGFVPGEPAIFTLNFSNESQATIKKIEACLDQEIRFVTFGKEKLNSTQLGTAVYNLRIVPNTNGTWTGDIRVPPGAYLTDLGGCRIIRIQYLFKVKATVSLCRNSKIEVPITVGTISSPPVTF